MKKLLIICLMSCLFMMGCQNEAFNPEFKTEPGRALLINASLTTEYQSCGDFLDDCQTSSPSPWLCHTRYSCYSLPNGALQIVDNWTVSSTMEEAGEEISVSLEVSFNGLENPNFEKLDLVAKGEVLMSLNPISTNDDKVVYEALADITIRDDILRAKTIDFRYENYLLAKFEIVIDDLMY